MIRVSACDPALYEKNMLVFFSDIHLTDGSSGETINAGAFDLFADQVAALAHKRQAAEVRVVLLGDGLDVIRSGRWLDNRLTVRPWSPAGDDQEVVVLDILRDILRVNREALGYLGDLPSRVASHSGVPAAKVHLEYLLGNHDWLINRYRSSRQLVVEALRLPPHYVDRGYPWEFASPHSEYDLIVRHGDCFDYLNYEVAASRDASSLGDVVVIELLHRFPLEVGRMLAEDPAGPEVVHRLKEIDNVRPYSRIPAWITDAIADLATGDSRYAAAARQGLACCIRDFRHNPLFRRFVHRQLRWRQRLYLQLLLNQAGRREVAMLDRCTRLGERLLKIWRLLRGTPTSEYAGYALAEHGVDGRPPRFVVYGHTHEVELVPLVLQSQHSEARYYLNTGTWRSVWQRAETADRSLHFASWKEMTYAVIYHPEEAGGKHEFEMWTGSLRDRSGG